MDKRLVIAGITIVGVAVSGIGAVLADTSTTDIYAVLDRHQENRQHDSA